MLKWDFILKKLHTFFPSTKASRKNMTNKWLKLENLEFSWNALAVIMTNV